MAPNNRTTKAQRREAARAKARAMRQEQERRDKRASLTRRALLGVGAVAIAGVGGALYLDSRNQPKAPQVKGGAISNAQADRDGVPGPVLDDASWTYGGSLEPGSVASGGTIVEIFFDYSCHFCAYFENLHHGEIQDLVENGEITVVLRPSKLLNSDWTDLAMSSMGVVLDEQPDASFAFHAALMSLFARAYDSQDSSMLTVGNIVTAATEAGVSADVAAQFQAAVNDKRYVAWTALGDETLDKYKVTATPTVLVAGEKADLSQIGTATGLTDLLRSGGVE